MNAPCKECPNRVVGCHGKCETYQAFDAERVAVRKRNYEQSVLMGFNPQKEEIYRRNRLHKHRYNGYGGSGDR